MSRDVKHAPLWPMMLLFVIFPYFRQAIPEEPREELRAVYLARAITESFSLRINEVIKEHGELPGRLQIENDAIAQGAPGLGLLSVPPLLALKAVRFVFGFELGNTRVLRYLRVVMSVIPTCIVLLMFFVFMVRRGVHAHAARFSVVMCALSAPVWVLATGLSAAYLAGLCIVSSLAVIGDDEDWPSQASFVGSGLLAAFAVLLAYPALPIVAMIGVYAFTRARNPQWALGFLLPVVLAVTSVCVFHYMTTQTLFTVVERTAQDGSQITSFWGMHMPRFEGLSRIFVSNLGLLRWAPVLALAPLGLFFMVSRGDVGEATVLGMGMTLAILFASGEAVSSEPSFTTPLVGLAIVLGVWPLARCVEALAGVAGGPLLAGVLACWSLLQAIALCSTHIYVPSSYANPLRDLAVAMWRDGVYAQSLGHGVGLHGDLAVLPIFILVFVVACAMSLGGSPLDEGSGWRRVISAIIFGGALFYWQLSWSPEPARRERYLDTLAIERDKEQQRSPDARLVRAALRVKDEKTREAQLARGHAATAFGDNATALEQYRTLP